MLNRIEVNLVRDELLDEKWDSAAVAETREELMGYLAKEIVEDKREMRAQVADVCSEGMRQSPINIDGPFEASSSSLSITDKVELQSAKFIRQYNSGILFLQATLATAILNDVSYSMKGAFFHHPSEHTFDQNHLNADLEVQFMFSNADGQVLMVSVLFSEGHSENGFIQNMGLKELIRDQSKKEIEVDPSSLKITDLLNGKSLSDVLKESSYVQYEGSLTYAPCTEEGVTWIVILHQINSLSSLQIGDFESLTSKGKDNSRKTQTLNGRKVYIS
ncbi:hypothetical protein FGO68_gene5875 [Halteria grandinella]|uniref:carbonic anhydrase n=1 Tax=Halteria grandinella TaxID=5974 RepID=A0A8J8NZ28_HALGN|nr:hypothetical protein FGO68_gene5875 [Halteria grandinella]